MQIENEVSLLPEQQGVCDQILIKKYAHPGEKSRGDICARVAAGLATNAEQERDFFKCLMGPAVLGGRINRAIGANLVTTAINCFVQPIGDSLTGRDDLGNVGITEALKQSAETMRRGGGVGYDFSNIRPKGAKVKGTGSAASGPVLYMGMFDSMCKTVESAGDRRGAQMGLLRIDHPDIELFIDCKKTPDAQSMRLPQTEFDHLMALVNTNEAFGGTFRTAFARFQNFNISVAVTNEFMNTLIADGDFDLVHRAHPGTPDPKTKSCQDGVERYVYKTVKAADLWERIMRNTYNGGDPGVVFIDHVNAANNLWYCETIASCNPCGEQFLPPYGCCDLGSVVLSRFVIGAFTRNAQFNWVGLRKCVGTIVEMLDRVLDVTEWPLPEQAIEARNKRRIGGGFTALGDALAMLGIPYGTEAAAKFAERVAMEMRDAAYLASIELAKKHGPFPFFRADEYLREGTFASTLPGHIKDSIREHGIRNSHLLSIAPTGTISIAFADNASSGIEPIFALEQGRLMNDSADPSGKTSAYMVNAAYRLFKSQHGESAESDVFKTAMDISVDDHLRMVEAVAPFVDSAISKTINIPADYPFDQFKHVYMRAWQSKLKGITTFRPNPFVGSVLKSADAKDVVTALPTNDPDRRIELKDVKEIASALKWPNRPEMPQGTPSVTYRVKHPAGDHAVVVGHYVNGRKHPVEVYVSGNEQPRGLAAIAKVLSSDMRTGDAKWLQMKIDALRRMESDDAFDLLSPYTGESIRAPSLVAGFAIHVEHALSEIGALQVEGESRMVNAMFVNREPRTGPQGGLSWTVDVRNDATGDKFVMTTKEALLGDGSIRPYSVWLGGRYPKVLDGLCKVLSIDMRVSDPAWVVMKLRKLLSFGEQRGDFLAFVPGAQRQQNYPSTVAYMAELLLDRYRVLGLLKGDLTMSHESVASSPSAKAHSGVGTGMYCQSCQTNSVHRQDGCKVCANCGTQGECG